MGSQIGPYFCCEIRQGHLSHILASIRLIDSSQASTNMSAWVTWCEEVNQVIWCYLSDLGVILAAGCDLNGLV